MRLEYRVRALAIIPAMFLLWVGSQAVNADDGKPVAVRWWGHAMVSIETYWNLRVVIDPYSTGIGYDDPHVSADLVLITHEHPDHSNADLVGGEPVIVRGLDDAGNVQRIHHVLDRLPNADEPWWKDARLRIARSEHAVVVTSVPAWHDAAEGSERGASAMFLIEVDGLRIVHCGDLGQRELTGEQLSQLGQVDVLLIPVGGSYTVDGPQAAAIVRQVGARIVVPIHYKTAALKFDLAPVEPFLEALGSEYELTRPVGNTLAVSANRKGEPESMRPKVVVPKYRTWGMPSELAELFQRMDAARQASQEVFAPLTAKQMNFKPSNGTHTPRWNAEHMMGRELGFFTQIYAGVDATVPHIDLNPEQMPPDYKAAHPDWSGEEEARQMERAGALVRRFAYLLDGIELDSQPSGTPWTLRGLLEQMERHYNEHTANVKKKFELPDWPKE